MHSMSYLSPRPSIYSLGCSVFVKRRLTIFPSIGSPAKILLRSLMSRGSDTPSLPNRSLRLHPIKNVKCRAVYLTRHFLFLEETRRFSILRFNPKRDRTKVILFHRKESLYLNWLILQFIKLLHSHISGASITFWLSHIARYAPSPARRYLLPEMWPCINISYWMEPNPASINGSIICMIESWCKWVIHANKVKNILSSKPFL